MWSGLGLARRGSWGAERRPASAHKDGHDWPRIIFPSLPMTDPWGTNCVLIELVGCPHDGAAFRACVVRLFGLWDRQGRPMPDQLYASILYKIHEPLLVS